ncbi:MAG TPA: cytochrome c-type biogenesis protein [Alphaproteobacteria bacterium]|nr:cytochrome c-type biogenesis protein [Alphaproteobacteria bacterium]
MKKVNCHRINIFLALLVLLAVQSAPARAAEPGEMLHNPAQEARAEKIGEQLRCLVCQNESIEASAAPLAHDLRVLIRHLIVKGDSNAQVKRYIVARYGNYVLLKPPFMEETLVLWLGPAFLLLAALVGFAFYFRTRREPDAARLSGKEQKRLDALLNEHPDQGGAA